ncbi:MAG: small multi-drug export protein [Spirochaetae bacterium HGW-Spirochaetae-1]|jgi:hypothetical protein|nr:MAG: small multi-drug export protein [Spirochaetae bacterium HGW-Spirochaetae-1]
MKILIQIVTVMVIGAGFFWGGFPAALAFKFPVLIAGVITAAGAELAVLIVVVMGGPLQAVLRRKFPSWIEKTEKGRVGVIWQKYGMPGLGLVSPILPGAPQAALIGLVLSASPRRVILWVSLGIIFWSVAVTAGLALGIEVIAKFIQ